MVTEDRKWQRVEAAREFLQAYEPDGEEFLDTIVTEDETWVHYTTPETKQLKEEVLSYLRGAAGEFYDSGIKKMVHRMQKCIDLNGDYVQK
jgi:hypothetical protein